MSGARGVVFLGATLLAVPAAAQTVVELRASTTKYRYVDVAHTFASGAVVDLLYLGAPGADELYVGAGYQWKAATSLTLTPILYAVAGKQAGECGIVPGALVSFDKAGEWNPLVGPVVKRNDARGSWAVSLRWGYRTDARLVRIITF